MGEGWMRTGSRKWARPFWRPLQIEGSITEKARFCLVDSGGCEQTEHSECHFQRKWESEIHGYQGLGYKARHCCMNGEASAHLSVCVFFWVISVSEKSRAADIYIIWRYNYNVSRKFLWLHINRIKSEAAENWTQTEYLLCLDNRKASVESRTNIVYM